MPRPDPIPSPNKALRRRFWRIFRLLTLLSVVIAAVAVLLVTRGEGEIRLSLILSTAAGVGFTVLLGTSLMALLFLSAESGHDDAVSRFGEGKREE